MRRLKGIGAHLASLAILASILLPAASSGLAAEAPAGARANPAPAMDSMMGSSGWLPRIVIQLEAEAMADLRMLPATPGAVAREWRSFHRNGSALGALVNLGWVALAACLALAAEWLVVRSVGRRARRAMRLRLEGPVLSELLLLAVCDMLGLAAFVGIFIYSRHWLGALDVSAGLLVLAANVVIRWRIVALCCGFCCVPASRPPGWWPCPTARRAGSPGFCR